MTGFRTRQLALIAALCVPLGLPALAQEQRANRC